MKRLLCMLAALLLCFSAAYARGRRDVQADSEKISVVSVNFPGYDFARAVAGEKADLLMLLPPGAESHSFEPTPQDIVAMQSADLVIYAGGEFDVWVDRILESINNPNLRVIRMVDTVDAVVEEIVEGMEDDEHDHGHGEEAAHDEHDEHEGEDHEEVAAHDEHEDEHEGEHHEEVAAHDEHEDEHEGEHHEEVAAHDEHEDEHEHHEEEIVYDEHVWTSPKNAQIIVRAITDALCQIDTANAALYRGNADGYIAQLGELDKEFQTVVDGARRKTLVFGDRFPFRYFTDAYGLDYFAAFPGCSTETEPSATTVAFLITKVKTESIPVVFHIELSNERMADTIAAETGATKRLLHAGHNITKRDFDNGLTFLEIQKANIPALREALQ